MTAHTHLEPIACPKCHTEIEVGAIDDIAAVLHQGVHQQMQAYVDGPGWPNEVERLVYASIDTALALFIAFIESLDAETDVERVH